MKLEDLIRKTSKEENPRPNYFRLMRAENKVEAFERKMEEVQKYVPDRHPRKLDYSKTAYFKQKLRGDDADIYLDEERMRETTPFE